MKNQLQWRRFLIEAAVIVGSILLAFAIDAYWAERTERVDERAELLRIRGEVIADRDRLATVLQVHERAAQTALEFFDLLAKESEGTVSVPVPTLRFTLIDATFELRTPALDGLLRSGRLAIVREPDVRAALADLEGRVRDASERQLQSQEFVADILAPAMARRGDVGQVMLNHPDRPLSVETLAFENDAEIRALVARRQSFARRVLINWEAVGTSMEALVLAIDVAVDD